MPTHAATDDERPDGACLLHPPPSGDRPWTRADDGYRTCSGCLDDLRERLKDIGLRYHQINPAPGASGAGTTDSGGRGPHGFGSKPAATLHAIAFTDPRSKPCETDWDRTVYEGWARDPVNGWIERPLPDGVHGPAEVGVSTRKRDAWIAGDGRAHSEPANPPRAIRTTLDALAGMVAEESGVRPPRLGPRYRVRWPHVRIEWFWDPRRIPYPLPRGVHGPNRAPGRWVARPEPRPLAVVELVVWLDRHLDWVTRQDWVTDFAEQVRALQTQLMPVTGDPRIWVARCPNTIDLGDHTEVCDANLYYPASGDTITCGNPACRRRWPRAKWHGDAPDCLSSLIEDKRARAAA